MRTYLSLVAGLIIGLAGIGVADAQSNRNNRDEVCVYHDNYYQGASQCYRPGDEIADLGGLSRNISSIHVYGRARVTLFEGRNFQGNSIDFTSDVVDLARVSLSGSQSWNDRAGSLRVSGGGYGYGTYRDRDRDNNGWPDNRSARSSSQVGICVYDRSNYQGRSECFDAGESISNLARSNWGDRIASVRVYGGARAALYTNAGYGGARLVVDRDIPDMSQVFVGGSGVSWNRQISSLQVERSRGRGYGYRDDRYYYDRDRYYDRDYNR